MPLSLFCNLLQTTNYAADTAIFVYTTSGVPLTGPPDWTATCENYAAPPWDLSSGFYTSPVFTSKWTVSGTEGTGEILGIYFTMDAQFGGNDETSARKNIYVVLKAGGGAFTSGGSYTLSPPSGVQCFGAGTRILTMNGYKAIETLTAADKIKTSDGRVVSAKGITFEVPVTTRESAPYRIEAGAFGRNKPAAPITLSPTHRLQISPRLWTCPVVAATKGNKLVKQYGVGESMRYYHIECENYLRDNLVAEGLVVESLAAPGTFKDSQVYTWSARLEGYTRIGATSEKAKKI
jgi:hypothetical protein